MAKQLGSVFKSLKEYTGTAANAAIVAVTAGIEQLTTLAIYRCPCVSVSQLTAECRNVTTGSRSCYQFLNYGYGLAFITLPAFALLLFGVASSPRMWKTMTGYLKKTDRHKREWEKVTLTVFRVVLKAVIAPAAWVSVSLLDGRFLACSITALPYDVDREGATFSSCRKVASTRTITTSVAFNHNKAYSQVIGALLTAALLFFAITTYMIMQCTSPLTYYHDKYYRLYRESEETEFDQEMSKMAQEKAEANVLQFMSERRKKNLWDRISSVFDFHRDKDDLALYSNLHEWIIEEKNREATKPQNDNDGNKNDNDQTRNPEMKTDGSDHGIQGKQSKKINDNPGVATTVV